MMHQAPPAQPIAETLKEYGRGGAGGLLFSLPLLCTMEVWWTGFVASPARLLAFVATTFGLLLLYNRYAGLRPDTSFRDVVLDSFEELALGVLLAGGVLWLLGRLRFDGSPSVIVGKVVVESMIAAVGVSVGTAQLGGHIEGQESHGSTLASQTALALCGAFLVAANIAPTAEIVTIAIQVDAARLLGMVALALAIAVLIAIFTGFRGERPYPKFGRVPTWLATGLLTYGVAVVSSATLLTFFDRFDGTSPEIALAQVVVLSVPAALGASAGRLLIQ